MRTTPATRFDSNYKHASYGITNWFANRGVYKIDVVKEVMANFCLENGVKEITNKTPEHLIVNLCQSHFNKFTSFAINYLRENNYLIQ